MQLSENLFAEITGVTLSAGSDRECDRRSGRRISFDHRARIFPLMEGVGEDGAAVLVRDISVVGIGFLFSEAICVGDEFVIRLPTTTEQPIDIQCIARRCELSGTCGSQFAVGATFELVINRPLSACIAPESEMPIEQEPLVDRPAPPSIEERYDRQVVASRLIRPIIRETRWDRWMAKTGLKKCFAVMNRIFWPAVAAWSGIQSALQAGEEARIRSRLSPSKASRKSKRKSRPAVVLPSSSAPAVPAAQPSAPVAQAPMSAIFHPHLFEPASLNAAATPTVPPTGRRSLFSAMEIAPTESAPPAGAADNAAQSSTPPDAPSPAASAELASMAAVVSEPLPATASENSAPPATASSQAQLPELVSSTSAQQSAVLENGPVVPAVDVQPAADDGQSTYAESTRTEQAAAKPRRPVAHPRQPRRRPRPTYHR